MKSRIVVSLLLLALLIPCSSWAGVDFDETDDRIEVGVDLDNLHHGDITISAWVYYEEAGANDHGIIFSTAEVYGKGWFMRLRTDGSADASLEISVEYSTTDADWRSTPGDVPKNVWTHILGTWDFSATDIELFVDGTEVVAYVREQNPVGTITDDSTHSKKIGMLEWGIGTFVQGMNGKINELAIWGAVLTQAEITLLSDSRIKGMPLQIQSANLQAYWALDDEEAGTSCDGDNFLDLSGNGNNGTGIDGGNNTGLTSKGEEVLSYSSGIMNWQ